MGLLNWDLTNYLPEFLSGKFRFIGVILHLFSRILIHRLLMVVKKLVPIVLI